MTKLLHNAAVLFTLAVVAALSCTIPRVRPIVRETAPPGHVSFADVRAVAASHRPQSPRGRAAAHAPGKTLALKGLAATVREQLRLAGGCTLDPRTGRTVGPIDAYAVSLAGYERRFGRLPTDDEIAAYLAAHETALRVEGHYVGAWHDTTSGCYFLDLTTLVPDRNDAEAQGRANFQRCICHLTTGQEIFLR